MIIFALLDLVEGCPVSHVHACKKQTKILWRGRNARRENTPEILGVWNVIILNVNKIIKGVHIPDY